MHTGTQGLLGMEGFDVGRPTTARMYDYWLSGQDNFAADRAAALRVEQAAPAARLMAIENRRFLQRAVRFLAVPRRGHWTADPGQRARGRPVR